jgi:hypothetical protein
VDPPFCAPRVPITVAWGATPMSGAGLFGLAHGGPMFTLYLLLVNLPFGIVTALVARAIIGKKP